MNTIQTGLKDRELQDIADEALRLAEDSQACISLATEWRDIQEARHLPAGLSFDARRSRDGRPVFIVSCGNGYHESLRGYEHALELLVDSHRTRVEDLESTHRSVMAQRGEMTIREARRVCLEAAQRVDKDHPHITGRDRDRLVLQSIGIE